MAKKTAPTINPAALFWLAAAYHLLTLVADGEAVAANWRRYQRTRAGADFLRLLLAEGVFIKDLGLAA
jgi:hypothetical protein